MKIDEESEEEVTRIVGNTPNQADSKNTARDDQTAPAQHDDGTVLVKRGYTGISAEALAEPPQEETITVQDDQNSIAVHSPDMPSDYVVVRPSKPLPVEKETSAVTLVEQEHPTYDDENLHKSNDNLQQEMIPSNIGEQIPEEDARLPVLGWIVIVSGVDRGRSVELNANKLFLSEQDNQLIFGNNDLLANKPHCAVMLSWDTEKRCFVALDIGNSNSLKINDKPVFSSTELSPHDKILIGSTTLVFVPFLRPDEDWNSF